MLLLCVIVSCSEKSDDELPVDDMSIQLDMSAAPDVAKNETPLAGFDWVSKADGQIVFDASESSDPDGDTLTYEWTFSDGEKATGKIVERQFGSSACFDVSLKVSDGTEVASLTQSLAVSLDTLIESEIALISAPIASAILPRDVVTGLGLASVAGTIPPKTFGTLIASVEVEGKVTRIVQPICNSETGIFRMDVPIPAVRRSHNLSVRFEQGSSSIDLIGVDDLVAGDIYVIQGQSNAVASTRVSDMGENNTPFVRTFGDFGDGNDYDWWTSLEEPERMGQWPLRMAAQLSEKHDIPIGIINGAIGGAPIHIFQKDAAALPDFVTNNYAQLFRRLETANLIGKIRAFFWYQGESDRQAWERHQTGFLKLLGDWREDYPNVERIYVTQLREGCIGGYLLRSQEFQRQLGDDFEDITVMSTNGLKGHDGCHYEYEGGYKELGDHYAALVGRDLYGEVFDKDVLPPNPSTVELVPDPNNLNEGEVVITMRNPQSAINFEAGAENDFTLEGSAAVFTSGQAEGNRVTLRFTSQNGDYVNATGLSYIGRPGPDIAEWVLNERGIGLLSFYNFPFSE